MARNMAVGCPGVGTVNEGLPTSVLGGCRGVMGEDSESALDSVVVCLSRPR